MTSLKLVTLVLVVVCMVLEVTVAGSQQQQQQQQAFLVYADQYSIFRYELQDGKTTRLFALTPYKWPRITALAYDHRADRLYWADKQGTLKSTTMPPGGKVRVLTRGVKTYGLSYDWINGNLYYLNSKSPGIQVFNVHTKKKHTLRPETSFDSLTVDPREGQGYVYCTSQEGKVWKVAMDGSQMSLINEAGSSRQGPQAVSVDMVDNRLFWILVSEKTMYSSDLNGDDRRAVLTSDTFGRPSITMTVFGNKVYWTDARYRRDGQMIYSIEKTGAGKPQEVVQVQQLMDMLVIGKSQQPSGPAACGDDNGGCEDMCLPSPGLSSHRFTCTCKNDSCKGYIGCFEDGEARTMPHRQWWGQKTDNIMCQQKCGSLGASYAGTQHGQECYCSNSLPPKQVSDSECSSVCTNDYSRKCGGPWRLSVYHAY